MTGGPAVLTDGSTAWVDGALVQAMKRPGMIIVLDELTIAPPGVQALFHGPCSDARSLTLPTGEVVRCAPGVVFVTADNTFGFGDETGQYAGTHAANAALVNRFKRVIRVDYMSKADEAKAIVNHTGCPKPAADCLAEFVSRARKMPEMENVALSLRQMTGFVQTVQDGFTPKQAASVCFLNRLPSAERAALETLFTLTWAQEFAALVSGSVVDANNPSQTGPDSAAAKAFDDEVSAAIVR
jgi:MoxR-like ATPase